MYALGGNDTVHGSAHNDWLDGGDGNDRLEGGANNDVLIGGAGNDNLYGGSGDDQFFGDAGADSLRGEAGSYRLWGNSGNDLYYFNGSGFDVINDGVTNGGTARTDTTYDTNDHLYITYTDADWAWAQDGDDLWVVSQADLAADGDFDHAVIVEDFFLGWHDVIENLHTTEDLQVSIADAQALAAAQPHAKLVSIDGMSHTLKHVDGHDRGANIATYTDLNVPSSRRSSRRSQISSTPFKN